MASWPALKNRMASMNLSSHPKFLTTNPLVYVRNKMVLEESMKKRVVTA